MNKIEKIRREIKRRLENLKPRIVWQEKQEVITRETGAFLTKRACKEYIEHFGYNHIKPHTYAMCAYRNFELARLLKILKAMPLEDVQQ